VIRSRLSSLAHQSRRDTGRTHQWLHTLEFLPTHNFAVLQIYNAVVDEGVLVNCHDLSHASRSSRARVRQPDEHLLFLGFGKGDGIVSKMAVVSAHDGNAILDLDGGQRVEGVGRGGSAGEMLVQLLQTFGHDYDGYSNEIQLGVQMRLLRIGRRGELYIRWATIMATVSANGRRVKWPAQEEWSREVDGHSRKVAVGTLGDAVAATGILASAHIPYRDAL
jgi:hypothetical protein